MKAVAKEERRVAYPLVLIFLLLAAGIATAAIGLLALLGWILHLPQLTSFGAELIPMAPGTALLFLLYGVAVCLRARTPLSQRVLQISVAMVGLGTMIALLLFTLRCLNIYLDIEHPGLNLTETVGGAPIGHMSPVNAFCFLLAGLSFLASLSTSATRPWRSVLAMGAAGLIAGTGFIFLLAYIYGTPLLYGSKLLPPALNSVLNFVMLGLALMALAGRPARRFGGLPGEGSRTAIAFALIFVLLAAGVVTVGYRSYRNYERNYYSATERQLSAIADLKVDELTQYRKERLWDAGAFFKNVSFSGLVRRFLEHPEDTEAQQQIQQWTAKYLATEQYDLVCLFDAQGVIRLSVPTERPPISSAVSQRIPEVVGSGQVTLQDFHRNEHDQQIYLTLLVPILNGTDDSQALGVLALRINPKTYLYPFIQHWPAPSQTAETLLIRREGNDARYLNDLRYRTNAALNLSVSLEQTNVPAVRAALGQTGITQGVDYRGVPVITVVRAVSDSPWFLVAKIDKAEVFAPLRERLRLTILLVSLLLVGVGLGIGMFWRHQGVRFYKDQYQMAEALRESEERFGRVFEEGPTGMAMLDEAFRFIQVNPVFSSMLGYSEEELQKMTFPEITHPDHVQKDVEQVRRLLRGELVVYQTEKRYITKSGKELWGQVQVSVVRNATGEFRYFFAIISDITERRRAEAERRENEERLRFHTENSPMAVIEWNADLIITRWTGAAEKMFGWSAEEAIGKPIAELPKIYEEDLPAVQSVIKQLADGVSKNVFSSNRNRTRKGQVIHCEWYSSVLHDAGGKIISVLSQVLDITERKRAEEALEQSRRMLRTVLDTIPTRVFWKDMEGRYLGGNSPFARDAGLDSPEALLGKDDYAMGWKEQADLYRADDRQVITSGIPKFQYEEPQTTPAGTQLWLRTSKIPLRDLEGRIIGVLGTYEDVTEHKRAQERVVESEKYLNKIINSIADPIFVKDRQHRWVLLNEAFCDFMGHKRDELIGKSDHDFFPKSEADVFAAKDEIVFNTETENVNEEEFTDSKGNTHTILTKKALYTDEKGEKFIVGIIRDITERKRAEETIVHERQLLRTLIDLLPEIFYVKDMDSKFLMANDTLAKSFGKDNYSQLIGLSDADFFPAGMAAACRAEEKRVLAGEPLIDHEDSVFFPDGRKYTLLTTKVPFRDSQGRICGLVGIGRDITERKRAEELLHYEQTLVATMMENIPDAVYFKDTASRFLRANRALSRKFGVSDPAQLVGKSDADFFSGEHAGQALADEQKIIRTGQPLLDVEEKETWPDGTVGWVLTSKLPLRNAAGQIIGTCGISRDITERKRAEEMLRRSHEEFKNLFDDAPVGFHEVDTAGRLVRINNTELKMLGYSAEELLGQFVWKISAEEETSHRATLAKLGGEPPPEVFQRMLRRKDGSTFPALISDRILKGANGAIAGIRSAIQDDTARWQAEEAMRLSEERLLRVITQTRCILSSGQVEGPAGWRERALNPVSPFRWDFPVQNGEMAQKILPLELAAGERYQEAWVRSLNRADHDQMNWNSGNAFLNDLPFYRNEFRCTDKNGVGHWMQQFVSVKKLAENHWQVFGITTDISDLKRVETELRESQALYHSLVDQIPAAIFRKDAKGRFVFVNSAFCRLKDMTPDQFLGKTASELGLKDVVLATKGASDHATIMQSGNPIEEDEVYSRADGETRNYHAVKSPVFNSAGKIVGTQEFLFDITERKRAEEALRWSETQLQVILESTADGILAVDSKGKVIEANQRFAELWRIPQSVMDSGDDRVLLDFVLEQLSDPDTFLKKVQSLYGTDAVDMDTLVFKDGRVFERYSFPMIMDGAVIGRVWSFRDITGRKRQEKELSEKNAELERFTYTVSHDLKSPLVTVKTFLGYLEQDLARPDKERVKQDVAYMHTAADKMGRLLDELLNLARVGRKMNPAERVTFKELAQEAVRLVAGRISTGGAQVQVADAAVVLKGDRPRLMEIWQNLVENACKFMGNQPKPRVEIGVERRGPETVFFVRDNGAGIDPRYQAKVFGLFEKLDPKGEGTGMGLALVKRIVEMYKGRIWVESPGLGQGANFLFTLPGAVIIDPEQSS